MLTTRGRLALLLAAGFYLVAWAFGTEEAYPLALGLAIAVVIAALVVRAAPGPFRLVRRAGAGEAIEGADLPISVEVRTERGMLPHGAHLLEGVQGIRDVRVDLARSGDVLRGRYVLEALARGRYGLEPARLVVTDPFGLQQVETELEAGHSLVVYPRFVELERLFSDAGGVGGDGRRLLLSRSAGYDLHGVRDYQEGESLRGVHWKSTAKRRKLMVKELEDSPREEAAVVLDARAGTDVGTPPDSSFEMQVRVAASILRRLVTTGQRAALITNGARLDRLPVTSGEGDWRGALEFLAGVQADGRNGLAAALEDGRGTLEAQRLYLVTAELTPRLADRVGALAVRREIAVAWVDARTWNGARAEPGLAEGVALTLARMGVPLARVRRGDDLRRVLDPRGDAGHAPAGDGHHRERTAVPA